MIIDHMNNAALYHGVHQGIRKALAYLANTDVSHLPPGRHDIDGDKVYALAQQYETRPREKGVWEAHRRYIDVQLVATGSEIMGYAPIARLTVTQPYATEKDCMLLAGSGDFLTVRAGMFAVFFPGDAHMPCLACGESALVSKVVVKVLRA